MLAVHLKHQQRRPPCDGPLELFVHSCTHGSPCSPQPLRSPIPLPAMACRWLRMQALTPEGRQLLDVGITNSSWQGKLPSPLVSKAC